MNDGTLLESGTDRTKFLMSLFGNYELDTYECDFFVFSETFS